MKEKVKVLFTSPKSTKKSIKQNIKVVEDIIEKNAPDMYEFIEGYGEDDIIAQVEKLRPEIIVMGHDKLIDVLGLLKKIKQLHPPGVVFSMLPGVDNIDNEQETIDEYVAAGAYKCYFSSMNFDTLIHDMYVALNLE